MYLEISKIMSAHANLGYRATKRQHEEDVKPWRNWKRKFGYTKRN